MCSTGCGEVAVQDDEAAKQIHSQFMQMALQLVDGRLDSSQYEDSCRQLLGIHCCLLCRPHRAAIRSLQTCLSCKSFCSLVCPQLSAPMPFELVATHALHKFLALMRMHTCQQRGLVRPGLIYGSVAPAASTVFLKQKQRQYCSADLLSTAGILLMHLHAITQPLQLLTSCN